MIVRSYFLFAGMSGSTTTLLESPNDVPTSSRLLESSLHLSISKRKTKSDITKAYEEASTLFLTRRLSEAHSIIEQLVTAPQSEEDVPVDEESTAKAPIANAKRSLRKKVWVFYLTLLDAIADLGPVDGKTSFGSEKWKELVSKAEDGSIWDEVINVGYGGIEEDVDAEVVQNLVTLLLAQSSTQHSTQQYLESYLSKSNHFDLELQNHSALPNPSDDILQNTDHTGNTDTPSKLSSRLEIIELYTLHVLPRVGEYEYAKDFIKMSGVLDEENKERFLYDLQNLQEEEAEEVESFEDGLSPEYAVGEGMPTVNAERESVDTAWQQTPNNVHTKDNNADIGISVPEAPTNTADMRLLSTQFNEKPLHVPRSKVQRASSTRANHKVSKTGNNTGIDKRSMGVVSALQRIATKMTEQVSQNPMGLLRLVLFLLGFLVAIGRRDLRDRIDRLTDAGWVRLRRTLGMGVKVSYI